MSDTNKVKFGLKNVHFAVGELQQDGSATFQKPVRWPGGVNLSLEAQGDINKFRADDIDFYVSQSNNGYQGDYESAKIPETFKKDVLGEVEDENGVVVEVSDAPTKIFALLFEFMGDKHATRHVMYNCTSSRPSVAGQTTGETIEPQTETASLTASTIWNAALKKNIVKARCAQGDAAYDTWFDNVYIPGAPITPTATRTVTQNLTDVTSSFTGNSVADGEAFTATLTAESGMTIGTVTVTMGGTDISETAWDETTGTVTITSVSGDVVITASAS